MKQISNYFGLLIKELAFFGQPWLLIVKTEACKQKKGHGNYHDL